MTRTLLDTTFSLRRFSPDILTWLLKDEKHPSHYLDSDIIERSTIIKKAIANTITFENQHPLDIKFFFGFTTFLGSRKLKETTQIWRLIEQYKHWSDFRYAPLEKFLFEQLQQIDEQALLWMMQYLTNRVRNIKAAQINHLLVEVVDEKGYQDYIITANQESFHYFTKLKMCSSQDRSSSSIQCSIVQGGIITKCAIIDQAIAQEERATIDNILNSIPTHEMHSHEQDLVNNIIKKSQNS
jgi:hypothetical protein